MDVIEPMDRKTALVILMDAVNTENAEEILRSQGVELIVTAETTDEQIEEELDGNPTAADLPDVRDDLHDQIVEFRDVLRAIAVLSEELK